MRTCAGIKRDGGRCTTVVTNANEYCYFHDPHRAEERKRNASRAGRSKPGKELLTIKQRLSDLADDVLAGEVDRSDAAVVGQLLNTVVRTVSVELKVREQEELVRELEELKEIVEANRRANQWGA